MNEQVLISLRTSEALDLGAMRTAFGEKEVNRLPQELQPFIKNGLVRFQTGIAQLTDEGMLRADGIAAALFV